MLVGWVRGMWKWIRWNWQPLLVVIFALSFIWFLTFGIIQQITNNNQDTGISQSLRENREVTLEVRHLATTLQDDIINGCQKNGNKVREVLQRRIRHEIEQSKNISLYEKLFPNLTEEEIEAIIAPTVEERRKEEKEIEPINCVKQYR